MHWSEVAIVGAGPIGIEVAVALKQRGIEYVHFDAGPIGATMYWWPPQTRWFSSNERIAIAGVPLQTPDQGKATREEYLRYLRTVVSLHDLAINTYESVTGIERRDGGFVLRTKPLRGEQVYSVKRIVLATGGTARPRKLGVPGEDLPHVSHHMEDPHKYFRKRVLIVGGKNSAIEAAIRLHHVEAEVSISYRRPKFTARSIKYWLYPEFKAYVNAGQIKTYMGSTVGRITRECVVLEPTGLGPEYVNQAEAEPTRGSGKAHFIEARTELSVDFVLMLVGYEADMSLAKLAGVQLCGASQIPVYNEQTMETNAAGVYVAGTAIAGTQDKYRVFLENCHIHCKRIVAALTGAPPPAATGCAELPES